MKLIKIGKFVNTHGIKGEIRLLSDFKFKNDVFKKGIEVVINNKNFIIETYRVHKNYDMLTLKNINNINDILMYKGYDVFIDKEKIEFSGLLDEDLIGLEVISNDKTIGFVTNVIKNKANDLLEITNENKKSLIPNIKEFVLKIENKKIYINAIKGLIDED
ncbi:MAG: ribosome maturation factor RimM [Mycoplasmatota bacterium]